MKVKFTKLAALLLAGAALLAAGCTDYEVDIQKVDKKVDELAASIDSQIAGLNATIATLETAANHKADIDKVNKAISDLETALRGLIDTKLDKTTFDAAKAQIDAAIADVSARVKAIEDKDFQKQIDDLIAAMNNALATINSRLTDLDNNKADKEQVAKDIAAVKTELEGKINDLEARVKSAEDAIKTIEEETIPALKNRVTDLENNKLNITDFNAYKEATAATLSLMQTAIQNLADTKLDKATFEAAMAEITAKFGELKNEIQAIADKVATMYDTIETILGRVQSIVFVPDYDDLKITSNMAYVTQPVDTEEEAVVTVIDQPSEVTYKILPASCAAAVADAFADYLVFDVKPVNTRAEDAAVAEPEFQILDVKYDDDVAQTGIVTFLVQPKNVASAQFAANGLKPNYEIGLWAGTYVSGWNLDGSNAGYFSMDERDYIESYDLDVLTFGVWKAQDIEAYEARTAFAASLRLKKQDVSLPAEGEDFDLYYNEVASTYNVLYPGVTEINIPADPYKKFEDEDGNVDVRKFTAEEQHQELPYSALRENPVGEKESQNPKGYRVILDQAVPAAVINGKAYGIFPENVSGDFNYIITKEGDIYFIPAFTTTFTDWTVEKNTATADLDVENFVLTPEDAEKLEAAVPPYAEVEMNPAKTAAERKLAIGNLITGTYTFTNKVGAFSVDGDVLITKAQGEIDVDAKIIWTWKYDAIVDHNLFYPNEQEQDADGNTPVLYSRAEYPVNINAEQQAALEENLAITLADFAGKTPVELKITATEKDEDGEDVDVDPAPELQITEVAIADGKVNAKFTFPQEGWDKTYTVVAKYELDDAIITVNGTLVTIDRNREKVVLGPYEHTFIVNCEEYYDGYYHWSSEPLHRDVFEAFDANTVINVEDVVDFAFDAAQADFNKGELEGKLRMADPSGTAKGYVDFNRNDIVLNTMSTLTPEVLAGEIFNSGERSADDPNLWLGNEVTRNVTTYIGEEVELTMIFNYKVPDYNFLHLRYYTFNKDKEVEGLITQRDFADNDGSVLWWTQVNPSYFTDVPAEGETPSQADRVSNRYALADYDVAYINLAELAFNVVDEKDEIIEDDKLEELGLVAKFIYTDEELDEKDLPEVDQIDPDYLLYKSLWVDNTIFYYRTNEYKFIPALGQLALTVGGTNEDGSLAEGAFEFPVATRFEYPKNAVKFPAEELDYSTYAMVRWTPFQAPQAKDIEIVLDENKIYREPLFKGMTLKDNRPNGVSFYVIKDGEWVVGNAAATATASSNTNGYLKGVKANDAYHITTDFVYDTTGIPNELKKLLTVEVENGVPYVVYDYTSEVQFHGVVTIPVVVVLDNPWQEQLKFSYNVIIKGFGD